MRETGKGKFGVHIHYLGGGQEKEWYKTVSERNRRLQQVINNMTNLEYAEPVNRD